uniref:C2H2-type domain-containing protein n=1 Tax=Daucus carota subsp. sativus TaxID=79200 RepID=A0A165A9Q3_DAUCS
MEFWGVEVKAGEPLHVAPEDGELIHISQVALGEVKNVKSANYVPVRLQVDDKKYVIGTLSAEKAPQIMFDLVLEKDFTLSHDWKDGSLYFCGYTAAAEGEYPFLCDIFLPIYWVYIRVLSFLKLMPSISKLCPGNVFFSQVTDVSFLLLYNVSLTFVIFSTDDDGQFGEARPDLKFSDFSDEDESEDEEIIEKGKPVADVQAAVPAKSKAAAAKEGTSAKPKVTLVDPKKEDSDDSEDSDEDSDDESEDDLDDDDSDDGMSEDEETPKKVESSKKRPSGSEIKTPASIKKSKTETPQKTDGKKGAHTATPHPAKKSDKKAAETPKSSGQVTCKSCSKTFNSEKGLESHSKAKHGGK